MESKRQQKMQSLLQQAMSEVLMREGRNFYPAKSLVSVTNVSISPDLSVARFHISIFNADNAEEIVQSLNQNVANFRGAIGTKLRNHLRKIPEITFFLDDTIEHMHKMNQIIEDLKPTEGEEDK